MYSNMGRSSFIYMLVRLFFLMKYICMYMYSYIIYVAIKVCDLPTDSFLVYWLDGAGCNSAIDSRTHIYALH